MLFEFRDVQKSYGVHRIFKNMNFSLERGTFSILTGKSGSGKTTLFKMLCGAERPTSGTVRFLDRDMSALTPNHLKQIGFIFQSPRGIPDLSVFDNIALPLTIDRVSKAQIEKRVMAWLDSLGLRTRAQSLYSELSGGELQKAEFARGLIRKPRLILADEPTAHLDPLQADHLLDILWDHFQDGATVFISTHHPPSFEHANIQRYHLADQSIHHVKATEHLREWSNRPLVDTPKGDISHDQILS